MIERTPQQKAEFNIDQAIKALVNVAKSHGLPSLLIGLRSGDGLIATHLEQLPVAAGMNIIVTAMGQLCEFEAGREGVEDRDREAIEKLQSDFYKIVRDYNAAVERNHSDVEGRAV